LAKRLQINVITLTSLDYPKLSDGISQSSMNNIIDDRRRIFTHLLALHGYYQVFYNQWNSTNSPVIKNIVGNESFGDCITEAFRSENIACAIIDHNLYPEILAIKKNFDSAGFTQDIPFMVLPEKFSYDPKDQLKNKGPLSEQKDTFLDSVIGDSDLFTLCSQKELSNS
jgi:hypothetical protein